MRISWCISTQVEFIVFPPFILAPNETMVNVGDLCLFETIYGVFNTRGIGLVLTHGGLQYASLMGL